MLIELNRFMTTEEVRKEYRIPDMLADEILPKAPAVFISEDGTRFHLEKEIDTFLMELRSLVQPQPQKTDTKLTPTERNIIEALGEEQLVGHEVAKKAGYPNNSNFRTTLSSMTKRGLLINNHPGYVKRKSGHCQD